MEYPDGASQMGARQKEMVRQLSKHPLTQRRKEKGIEQCLGYSAQEAAPRDTRKSPQV